MQTVTKAHSERKNLGRQSPLCGGSLRGGGRDSSRVYKGEFLWLAVIIGVGCVPSELPRIHPPATVLAAPAPLGVDSGPRVLGLPATELAARGWEEIEEYRYTIENAAPQGLTAGELRAFIRCAFAEALEDELKAWVGYWPEEYLAQLEALQATGEISGPVQAFYERAQSRPVGSCGSWHCPVGECHGWGAGPEPRCRTIWDRIHAQMQADGTAHGDHLPWADYR